MTRLQCDSFILSLRFVESDLFCGLNNGSIQLWDLVKQHFLQTKIFKKFVLDQDSPSLKLCYLNCFIFNQHLGAAHSKL